VAYVRKDVSSLTGDERRRFVNALLEIKSRGVYDEFVRTHITYYTADGEHGLRAAHMGPSFLPWHRRFLLELERALRRVDASVTLPYWDWTRHRSATSLPWTDDLLGGNGRGTDRMVETGPFAYPQGGWPLKEGVTDRPFLTRDLGRPAEPLPLPTRAELDSALAERLYDAPPWDSTSTKGFRNRLEGWKTGRDDVRWRNHNRVHRWVGGAMLGGGSVNDPVFWLHHAFVDLQWTRWQRRHKGARYLPAGQPGSGDRQSGRIVARHEKMPPWGVTPDSMEDVSRIYRYA
jgi:tyrosinase